MRAREAPDPAEQIKIEGVLRGVNGPRVDGPAVNVNSTFVEKVRMPFAAMALKQGAGIYAMSPSGVLSSVLVMGGSVMLVVGLLACTGPTLRTLRIAPDEALRQE